MGEALERVVRHVESLPSQPAADVSGAEALARSLAEPLPEGPSALAPLLDLLFERAIPKTFNAAGPGYLAYIPGGGLFATAVADLIADATNRYVGVRAAAPALVALETNVVRWMTGIVGLPGGSGGFLTSGGSLANFSAVVAARRDRLPENFLSGTLYVSDQVHHCVTKAALLAGFPPGNVRVLPSDDAYRLPPAALEDAVARDRRAGFRPFLVVGSAGTTNTGAVDDLPALADLCARERLWFHVDAAYGGFFLLTERGRAALRGAERADSLVLDPHKALFLPYGTGALLVRDAETLRRSHHVEAAYLPPSREDDGGLPDFSELSPELTRPFRGLRVWLPLKLHGAAAFRSALDEKLDLARRVADGLARIPELDVVSVSPLTVSAFRARRANPAEGDAATRAVLDRVNAKARVHLSGTTTKGRFLGRVCVVSFRTHADRVDAALEDLAEAARAVG